MPHELSDVRIGIRTLLARICDTDDGLDSISDTATFRESGVSSIALISLLVAMEEEFGFEWDDDVEAEYLRSIETLAGYVVALESESTKVTS